MIRDPRLNKYCKGDITKIENFDKAIVDESQTWVLHHRLETHKYKDRTRKEWIKRNRPVKSCTLVAFGLYYNRPPEELIFMTKPEHMSLHRKGLKFSEEHRKKLSEIKKGKPSGRKGEKHKGGWHHTEETKKRLSEHFKGREFSEETRRKISETLKGKPIKHWLGKNRGHWWTNGVANKLSKTCPGPGWERGRLISHE